MRLSKIKKIPYYLIHPEKIIVIFNRYGIGHIFPDKFFLNCLYKANFGKKLNLKNPQTYNEKLQWLKLYDRNPKYCQMVDKYEAKRYVSDIIGEECIVQNYGVWDRFDDIDFDKLPEQFVLKCTHDCGGLVICRDKSKLDIQKAKEKINKCLKRNYYWTSREWPYKNVKPRIIAEAYIEDAKSGELPDYKFFCFDGKVELLFIATDRQKVDSETKFDFFDAKFNHLPFTNGHSNADKIPEKPEGFEKMIAFAEKLSQGIPHVRVDFYSVEGKIYFGEMTFYHWSGMVPFDPEEWDYKLGEMIDLSKVKNSNGKH